MSRPHTPTRLWGAAVLAALLTALPAVCSAQSPPATEVERLAAEAQTAFGESRFGDAVALYLKAYQIEPAGILLYNVAYIYDRKLAEGGLASTYYRRYIQAPDAEPDLVQKATARLRELKSARPAEPPTTPTVEVIDDPPRSATSSVVRTGLDSGATQRNAGWGLLGGGGAMLVTGIVLGVLAQQEQDTFANSQDFNERSDARDNGRSMAVAGDVLMAVGATAAVTGLVLALTAPKDASFGFNAAPVPGGAVFGLAGSL